MLVCRPINAEGEPNYGAFGMGEANCKTVVVATIDLDGEEPAWDSLEAIVPEAEQTWRVRPC